MTCHPWKNSSSDSRAGFGNHVRWVSRSASGWQFQARVEELSYFHNL